MAEIMPVGGCCRGKIDPVWTHCNWCGAKVPHRRVLFHIAHNCEAPGRPVNAGGTGAGPMVPPC